MPAANGGSPECGLIFQKPGAALPTPIGGVRGSGGAPTRNVRRTASNHKALPEAEYAHKVKHCGPKLHHRGERTDDRERGRHPLCRNRYENHHPTAADLHRNGLRIYRGNRHNWPPPTDV